MSKVEIEKRGKVARVHTRVADMLVQRFGYQRRDMQAQPSAASLPPEIQAVGSQRAPAPAGRDDASSAPDAPKKVTKKAAAKTPRPQTAADKDASE